MICQKCGKVLPDGMKFCGYCGALQQSGLDANGSGAAAGKIRCNVCGAECGSEMVYCNCCGSKLMKESLQGVQPAVHGVPQNNLAQSGSWNTIQRSPQNTGSTPEEATPDSEFELRNKGEDYIIAKYLGKRKHVVIPSNIRGRKVVEIGDGAFGGSKAGSPIYCMGLIGTVGASKLESVVIPETVIKIGIGAFSGCKYLTKVKMHSGIKEIGPAAFFECSNISILSFGEEVSGNKRVHFPRGLELIGTHAFSSINLPVYKCYLHEVTLDKHTKVKNRLGEKTFNPRDVAVFYYND